MFEGKRGLVLGVANKRSIAWAIAQQPRRGGAQLAFTFQGERSSRTSATWPTTRLEPALTDRRARRRGHRARLLRGRRPFGGQLDLLVHSVAFAAAEDLEGRFTDTPRDRFWMALDVSAYSLVALRGAAEPLMEAAGGGSIVTMTYLGGERAVPHYNVMGVAKATLDASVRTSRGTSARRTSASTRSRPVLCARSPRARSPASRRWRRSSRSAPRCIATSKPRMSAAQPRTCSRTRPGTSRDDALRRQRVPRDGYVETARRSKS